jgi:hypothetical protein
LDTICREASRLTARRYRLACRRAGRERFATRLSKGASGLLSALSWTAVPLRAAATALVYISAGCAARLRHASRGESFVLERSETAVRRKHSHARVNTALAFVAAGVLIFAASIYRVGLEVILDGESIGYVSSQSVVEESLSAVSLRAGDILGRPFTISPDIVYQFSIVNKNKIYDSEGVEAGLLSSIPDIDRLSVLLIDGQPVGASWSPSDIHAVLREYLSRYSSDGQVSFVQDVSIQSQLAPVSLLRTPDEMLYTLTRPERAGKPLLSVQVDEQDSEMRTVPYDIEYVDDPTLWLGETKILQHGVDGEALVMMTLTSIDGRAPEVDVTGSIPVIEPVTEVVAVGTRTRDSTGTFIRPHNGQITSRFGMRTLYGKREMHYGVDFRGPRGDPILSSDGGTVIFAGTRPGYGLSIIIDHHNGYKTVYGHCSKLHVKEGDKVGQGEHIANIGSTGRSTGNHLHFEVQVNGVPKNPLDFVDKHKQ